MTHNPYAHNDDGGWWIHPEPQGPPDEPGPDEVDEAPEQECGDLSLPGFFA